MSMLIISCEVLAMKLPYLVSNSMVVLALASMLAPWSCDYTIFSDPGPRKSPTQSINITRQEYESALAKWQAAGIQKYEMVVRYSRVYSDISGTWTLRVSGENVEVVNRLRDGVPTTPKPHETANALKFLIVGSMFSQIKEILDDPAQASISIGGQRFEVAYHVEFDDSLGCPKSLVINPLNITDNDSLTVVESLDVIR
jgi:hypothetical protein